MMKLGHLAQTSLLLSAVFGSSLSLTSCQTSETVQVPPARQPSAVVVGPQPVNTGQVPQLKNTNSFPTFDGQLTAAGNQMSDAEAKEMESSLAGLGAARGKGAISEAEYKRRVEELRAIGQAQ